MGVKVHPSAEVSDKARIGEGTAIWNQAQVREDATIGTGCNIGKNVYIDFGVKIGDKVKIQNNACVYHGVEIENEVFIGPGVSFTNDLYPRASLWDTSRVQKTKVMLGASIGANSTIVCGDRIIGRYAMVGAGSVVTKNVPDYGLVVGNPARLIGFVCTCGFKLDFKEKSKEDVIMHCSKCEMDIKISQEDYKKLSK